MRPDISEFSYGYALTETLVDALGGRLTAAPLFPSLRDEARLGYDLKIATPGFVLFLQFKLSEGMVRASAHEISQDSRFAPVASSATSALFYRMHLRPRRHSAQHKIGRAHV